MAGLYLGKLQTYSEKYGENKLVSKQSGEAEGHYEGLAYAALYDFGSGTESLVVCYYDKSKASSSSESGFDPKAYKVEIWQYVAGSEKERGKIELRLAGGLVLCEDGNVSLRVTKIDGKTCYYDTSSKKEGNKQVTTVALWADSDRGTLAKRAELIEKASSSAASAEYFQEGSSVSQSTWDETASKWNAEARDILISFSKADAASHGNDALQVTEKTFESLRSLAPVGSSSSSGKSSASTPSDKSSAASKSKSNSSSSVGSGKSR